MNRSDLPSLVDFPLGSCGDVAILLGQYLHDAGLGTWRYVSWERPRGDYGFESHGWIELHGVIADITADQFLEANEAVIVTPDSSWHNSFAIRDEPGHDALIDVYDDYTRTTLREIYRRAYEHRP